MTDRSQNDGDHLQNTRIILLLFFITHPPLPGIPSFAIGHFVFHVGYITVNIFNQVLHNNKAYLSVSMVVAIFMQTVAISFRRVAPNKHIEKQPNLWIFLSLLIVYSLTNRVLKF